MVNDPETMDLFLSSFTVSQRLSIASMCIMENCKETIYTTTNDNKRRNKVFELIDKQLETLDKCLKSSYDNSMKM